MCLDKKKYELQIKVESHSLLKHWNSCDDDDDDVVFFFPSLSSQIAVVHYSDEPRIEIRLSDFKDRNSVLRALRALRYGGGNTKTG